MPQMFQTESLFTFTINNISYSLHEFVLKKMDIFNGILNKEISNPESFNITFDNVTAEQVECVFHRIYGMHNDYSCKDVAKILILESFMKYLGIDVKTIDGTIDYIYANMSLDSFVNQCTDLHFCPELLRHMESCVGATNKDLLTKINYFKYFDAAAKIEFSKKMFSLMYSIQRSNFDILCGLYATSSMPGWHNLHRCMDGENGPYMLNKYIVNYYHNACIDVNDLCIVHQNNKVMHLLINNKKIELCGDITPSHDAIIGVNTHDTIVDHIVKIIFGIVIP